jgi:hypothetical protein
MRQANAAALERGTVERRLDARAEILDVPANQRPPKSWTPLHEKRRGARRSEDDLNQKGGVFAALAMMLRQPADVLAPLTNENRRQIEILAERLLDRTARLQTDEITNLADLGLATRRSDLRAEVVRLANSHRTWPTDPSR